MRGLVVGVVVFVIVAAIAYYLSQKKDSPAPKDVKQQVGSAAMPGDRVVKLEDGSTAVMNAKGIIKSNATYKGKTSITQDAQISNILVREGVNTPIEKTANPLEVKYTVAGGKTFTSSRRPANDTERNAARLANLKEIAARDKSYAQTDSYKNAVTKLGG